MSYTTVTTVSRVVRPLLTKHQFVSSIVSAGAFKGVNGVPIRTVMSEMSLKVQPFSSDFLFRQLFDRESCTYTYLLGDVDTRECVLIDPVIELVDRDLQIVNDLGLKLKYAMNTHMHADHITGTGLIKKLMPGVKSVISKSAGAMADICIDGGDVVEFGKHKLQVRATPGHTNGCVTYVCEEQAIAFTGDALLIRGCGRTDFQEGNPAVLYESVHSQILSLPDHFKLFPAHDYKGMMVTTVAEEKKFNPRLTKPKDEFIDLMNNLNLPYPKKIDASLPANRVCGIQELIVSEKKSTA